MAGHRRETLALRKQEHNPKCMDFLQHSKSHWTWNDCFLVFMHYAICHWEFIFESVVRSQQWIHTCFGSWPASNHQNRKLLQRWIHSGLPRMFFCVTSEILKLSKVMLLNPPKISDLRKDFLWKRGALDRVSAMTYCAPFLFFNTNYHRRSLMRMACSRCGALLREDFLKILSSGWWFIWNLISEFP